MRAGRIAITVVLVIAACLVALFAVGVIVFPSQTADIVRPFSPGLASWIQPQSTQGSRGGANLAATSDADVSSDKDKSAYAEAHKGRPDVYPLVAEYEDVQIRSTIAPADLTGVLFHQASYLSALEMNTQLPEADLEGLGSDNPPRVNNDQIEGEWLDADAMHIWRVGDVTAMDTSIDIGAEAGTTLRSPVTGTVVLVKDYLLFDETPDIEIHIQPDGHPELDVVCIHNTDPLVKAGDHVQAGVTEIAHVRDIASVLTDIQLGYYTAEGDPGNHSHVQINNADYEGYREKSLQGAITVK